jgi:hypothetical protein
MPDSGGNGHEESWGQHLYTSFCLIDASLQAWSLGEVLSSGDDVLSKILGKIKARYDKPQR